jgi:hypothetical protein
MLSRVEPLASWYYALAWWPFILAMDALTNALQGHSLLWREPRRFLALSLLSVPVWLFFEAFNLVMKNWYYVGSSPSWAARWMGYTVCFATVLPAIYAATELVGALGWAREVRVRPFHVGPGLLRPLQVLGAACLALPLILPPYAFPLVWLGVVFLVEPLNYSRGRPSILRDWEGGSMATLVRLLAGGMICGLAWELFNIRALSKWIYTVPFFDELKLFEMPLAGFLGFPPFAVECYVLVEFLAGARASTAPRRRNALGWAGLAAAAATCIALFALLDRFTVNGLQPRVADLRDLAPEEASLLERAGVDRLDLWDLRASAGAARGVPGLSPEALGRWRQWAALASLRGMGTGNLRLLLEAGVSDMRTLAAQDPGDLGPRLRAIQADRSWARQPPTDAQVKIWVRGAGRSAVGGNPVESSLKKRGG